MQGDQPASKCVHEMNGQLRQRLCMLCVVATTTEIRKVKVNLVAEVGYACKPLLFFCPPQTERCTYGIIIGA